MKKTNRRAGAKQVHFKVDFCQNNIVTIHSTKKFPTADTELSGSSPGRAVLEGNKHPLIKYIRRRRGILAVKSAQYELQIKKAELFLWYDLLPKILVALKEHFTGGQVLSEVPTYSVLRTPHRGPSYLKRFAF